MFVSKIGQGFLLTSKPIKCSLVLLFSIVNLRHGTHGPTSTRNRTTRHRRILREVLLVRGHARNSCPAVLAGIASHDPFFFRRFLVSQGAGLCRPGLSRMPSS